ncbi:MAG: hypothetical protein GX915_08360 [Clostridiales bacterium]|nr:hypothetical protein [Clostridiales bacterium]
MIAIVTKRILLSCIIILCFLTKNVTAQAANNPSYASNQLVDVVEPMWDNTSSVEVNLSIDGSKAICGASVVGKTSTTKITGTVVLARKNSNGTYTPVKTWNNLETTGNLLIFDKTYYVSTGYTYRLTITSTVYRNGVGETVSGYYEAHSS